jgi:uncharacterized protein YndB with AHSA1/START domain
MAAGPSPVPAVTLVRTIPATAAEVFAAWTDASLLARWLAAHDCRVREASADARPGGAYRIAVVCPPADDVHLTTGEYRELMPPQGGTFARVVMTWRYDGPHGADDAPSLLTVELRERVPGTTELTLTHARARDLRTRELLAAGWPTCLHKLAALLAERPLVPPAPQGAAGEYRVTVTRRVAAPSREAFAAFTDPAVMSQWWTDVAVVEPRVGGRFRAESRGEGDAVNVIVGEYREFVPNERLVLTWIYDAPDAGPGLAEWLVRIDFADRGAAGTDITVTETETSVAARHAASAADSATAWSGALEQLAVFLDGAGARA